MNLSRHKEQVSSVSQVTWVGMIVNIFLGVGKIGAGYFSNSRALIADGIHSITDMVSDVAVLVGVHFWATPANAEYPYGRQRLEALVSLTIGVLLLSTGVLVGYEAIAQMAGPKTESVGSYLGLFMAVASIVTKEALYRWTLKKGAALKSQAVEANAIDHRADAVSSIPTAIAIAISLWFPEMARIDLWCTVLVAVFILHSGWSISMPAIQTLMDKGADKATIAKIIEITCRVPGVMSVHDVRTRYLGMSLEVDMHVVVLGSTSVESANCIAHAVEDTLCSSCVEDELGVSVSGVLVHLDPWRADGRDVR